MKKNTKNTKNTKNYYKIKEFYKIKNPKTIMEELWNKAVDSKIKQETINGKDNKRKVIEK